ncbi:Amuc_1100 family pilus-like protein [Pelagicoccus mobilis]|uniref:Uncharacterized protein n=1 Tax=Pelagicoccus mobilis TaxID=415221 RepID=A0A934RW76_9BACT|nr:hypothetical protein [Pelagicoccus mobilis]
MLLLLSGACMAGLWYLATLRGDLAGFKASYATKASQYDRYLAARPSPTRSNLEALEENYRELYEVFERTMGSLNLNTFDEAGFYGSTPVSRADWSFELHKYKENARYAALSNSIELSEEVDFGFDDYAAGGPPPENGKEVHEQIVIASNLLETLFDSGIRSFVKVQRGIKPNSGAGASVGGRPADRLFGDGEKFAVVPGQSLSIPGTIDSYVFRLVFRGQSIALRGFLNRIANSPLPFVVRGVEAGLASEGGEKVGLETLAENPFAQDASGIASQVAGVPIISDNTSLFVVTVEFLQLSVEVPAPDSEEGNNNA